MKKISGEHGIALIYAALVVATIGAFWQLRYNGFTNFDDDHYVTQNKYVKAGLTRESVIWAFTTNEAANWHPLTWLSHMLDCQLFGTNPGRHHFVSLLLHVANSVLLFAVFRRMTGALWQSFFVAAAFALHPLHVESVAWISERKDVVSTLFWMLTMLAYVRYVERPGTARYIPVIVFLILGLMAKPMLVTLPFVLLLLDYWPLSRFQLRNRNLREAPAGPNFGRLGIGALIAEKIPLLLISAASSVVTFLVQQSLGAVKSTDALPVITRISNALVSYMLYIKKMIWPTRLAAFYPHPGSELPHWQVVLAGVLLLAVTVGVFCFARKRRYLAVGWLWYLGTLVPVIGFVQVGVQAMADRYTYVPLTGLFIIVAWAMPDLPTKWRYRKIALGASMLVVLSILGILTYLQTGHWRNNTTLFEHAAKVTKNNYVAHFSLGSSLRGEGRIKEAIAHSYKALQIKPNYPKAHNSLGLAFIETGELQTAAVHFREALRNDPDFTEAHNNFASLLIRQNKFDEAVMHLNEALRIEPDYALAYNNLGFVYLQLGKFDEAVINSTRALQLDPTITKAYANLGYGLASLGRLDEAVERLTYALALNSDSAAVHYNLAQVLMKKDKIADAIEHLEEAVRLEPFTVIPVNSLAWLLATHQDRTFRQPQEAVRLAEQACELTNYADPMLLDTLAAAYAAANNFSDAIKVGGKALTLASSTDKNLAEEIKTRLQLYKSGRAVHEQPPYPDESEH